MSEYTIEGAMERAKDMAAAEASGEGSGSEEIELRDYITKLVEQDRNRMLDVLKEAHAALNKALPYMQCDEHGNGPDCTPIFQALINLSLAVGTARSASVEGGEK